MELFIDLAAYTIILVWVFRFVDLLYIVGKKMYSRVKEEMDGDW